APRESEKVILSLGGVLAGIGTTTCCVIPFTLVSLGAGGAWLSNLTALAPYQPYFLTAALALLAAGFWRVYRRPQAACADGTYCAKPDSDRIAKIGLWTGVILVVAALAFNTVVPLLLNS
ncbi:MAG: mercuric transporter MerT family protein, partial [Pseudomonadota bacterium]